MDKQIAFNSFYKSNNYTNNLEKLFSDYSLFKKKYFTNKCLAHLKTEYPNQKLLLTHSATAALELTALLLNLKPHDEVILPSYTYVSTASAFMLRGIKPIFVDIEENTLGINPNLVEKSITNKTKAIIAVHYGGIPCQIEALKTIANKHQLFLVEDAAMAFGSSTNNQTLGTWGDFGVVSFDITKHFSATQGGLLIVNNPRFFEQASVKYHLGTNIEAFQDKEVPYYEWVDLGSKFQMPETNAAILFSQLEAKQQIFIQLERIKTAYQQYSKQAAISIDTRGNEVFLLCSSLEERKRLKAYLAKQGLEAHFHYVPLHLSAYGKQHLSAEKLKCTETVYEQLLRLPFHAQLNEEEVHYICKSIKAFYA